MGPILKLAGLLITASAGLIVCSCVSTVFVLKLAILSITASVGASAGLFVYSRVPKNNGEGEVASSEDIYVNLHIDKVVIDAGGREVILSMSAE